MVTVKRWIGRTGNNLFQYAAARILAERNDLKLNVDWPFDDFIKVIPSNTGKIGSGNKIEINDTCSSKPHVNLLEGDYSGKNVELDGYFQNVDYYNVERYKIKSWFDLPKIDINQNDIVLHYRVSDYYSISVQSVIDPQWYLTCLRIKGWHVNSKKHIYIVTEDPTDLNVQFLAEKTKGTIISSNPKDDFHFIRSFKTIICSNGSFAWWAAFLSEAEDIYTFKKWMKYHNLNLAYMDYALAVPGAFTYDSEKANLNWNDYWIK